MESNKENISTVLKPNKPIGLGLDDLNTLKNPKLTITLEEDKEEVNQPSVLQVSPHRTQLYINQTPSNDCTNCATLKHLLYLRDRTILNLAEDRDTVKIKLTETMNLNIELSTQVVRYQKLLKLTQQQQKQKVPKTNEEEKEAEYWRNRCLKLEESNKLFKQHLMSLKSDLDKLKLGSFKPKTSNNNNKNLKTREDLNRTFLVDTEDDIEDEIIIIDNNDKLESKNSVICECDFVENEDYGQAKDGENLDSNNEDDDEEEDSSSFDLWYNS